VGVRYARIVWFKRAFVLFSYIGALSFSILFILMLAFETGEFALGNWGILSIAFLVLFSIGRSISTLTPSIVIPMIGDVSDYETYSSGRYILDMIAALFSFVVKLESCLAALIVVAIVSIVVFGDEFPTVDDEMTTGLLWGSLITALGFPMLGWVISIIAMKFYPLTKAKIAEVQEE